MVIMFLKICFLCKNCNSYSLLQSYFHSFVSKREYGIKEKVGVAVHRNVALFLLLMLSVIPASVGWGYNH